MEVNKLNFDEFKTINITKSFEELDVNNDGKINEADENLATNAEIKNAIFQILAYDVDEEPELLKNTVSQKASSSTSVRQNSQLGIPMTDVNTFENDVLKSKGTTYVCAGNGYNMAVKPIAANLPDIQKLANVYHLENVNTDIMNSLDSQLATILGRNGALMGGSGFYILKFVDGKLVDVFLDSPLPCGKNIVDILKEEAVGTPSSMPDVPEINKGINANKNKYGIYETNTKNFNNDVLSSKGTVYVTIGNSSCCYCKDLAEEISRNKQTLDPLCTIYSLSTDTDKKLCWQIAQDWGGLSFPDGMPLPQIAKFVDGKFVQIMPVKTVSSMIKLAEGTAKKDRDGISYTDAANFDKDIANSKGTTYVMINSSSGCQYCSQIHSQVAANLAALESKFGFYELDIDTNKALGWQIAQDWGGGNFPDGMPLPQIAKFVDGKFVELLTNTRDYGKGLDNAVIKEMLAKAEGTPVNTSNSNSGKTSNNTSAKSTKTTADITKAADDLKTKYSITNFTSGDPYSTSNPELTAFKKALDDGMIDSLSKEGFSRDDILDIIKQAFPNVGIAKDNKGGYTCPYGHGDDAKAIYEKFISELSAVSSPEVIALQKEIATLNLQIANNNAQMKKLKATIESLTKLLEKEIEKAIKESEEIAEEQKQEAADIVKEELNTYSNSDGSMTYDEFQQNVKNRLDALEGDGNSKMASVMFKILNSQSKMQTLNGYITQFGTLVNANTKLADTVKAQTAELDNAKKVASEDCENCSANRCDPIGFKSGDVQYDFFVDKDKNGGISNETEFLGAENGWAEMESLDTNNDGKVTSDEMKDLKLVTKDSSGNQTIKDASEIFNDDNDFIDLSSYKTQNKDFDNGNTLLGSFSVNIDGNETNNGYNTLDELSWLDDNYEFTDEDMGINRFAKGGTKADEVLDFSDDYTQFQTNYTNLQNNMSQLLKNVGMTNADINEAIAKAAEKDASDSASEIEKIFKAKVKKEEQ